MMQQLKISSLHPFASPSSIPTTVVPTPIRIRIALSRLLIKLPNEWVENFRTFRDAYLLSSNELSNAVWDQLRRDVEAVHKYSGDGVISEMDLKYWFPSAAFTSDGHGHNYDYAQMQSWINSEYDYIYTAAGLRLLVNRYLRNREPIQCCMLRIAKLFAYNAQTKSIDYELWHVFYKLVACGFIQVSSILADADQADAESIRPGEACCLMVATKKYDRTFIKQLEQVSTIVSMGVGVGISMATVPLIGRQENGYVHSGFAEVVKKLNASGFVNIYERKPKTAIYINTHCDTIFQAFDTRHPAKHHYENVFIGLMVSNYFMDCVRHRREWYLFPANATLNGANLSDFYGDEYVAKYKEFVRYNLYSSHMPATKLMEQIVMSIGETGGPYIIFEDHVNEFSNHKHLGKIKTLNLCAEITNYSTDTDIASCTLASVNFALVYDFGAELNTIRQYMYKHYPHYTTTMTSQMSIESEYAFILGFMSAWALNGLLGLQRERREIGINPMGIYDMAVLLDNDDASDVCARTTEALYMGAVVSSCAYSERYGVVCRNYPQSPFSYGVTQFKLRDHEPYYNWSRVYDMMQRDCGMANSMLTAQAPTATTSQLTGVMESVLLPMNVMSTYESENGRVQSVPYGIMARLIRADGDFEIDNGVDRQIAMYVRSAPFVDHSQSTQFTIPLTKQNIFNIIRDTYKAKLKTGIYYIVAKEHNTTLQIIRPTAIDGAVIKTTSTTTNTNTPNTCYTCAL